MLQADGGADGGAPTPEPQGDPNPPAPAQPTPGTPEFNKIAAEKRILEKRLADFEKAEAERKKAEMTEQERLKAERDEFAAKAAKLERDNLVTKAAAKAGLPPELWSRVQGDTADDIEADVASLLSFVAKPAPTPATTGQDPKAPPPPPAQDPKKTELEAAIQDAQKRGNVAEMLRLKGQLAALKG